MKIKLLQVLLIGISSFCYSQYPEDSDYIHKTEIREYYLIDKLNDTALIYGEILPIEFLHDGFKIFDKSGNKTRQKVNPDSYKYLFYKNIEGSPIRLKSLPIVKDLAFKMFYDPTNVFMNILIENPEEEIEKGKVDFYIHEFSVSSPSGFGPNGFYDYSSKNIQIFYFKDSIGLHQIKNKSHFKSFPKILGKELHKKMKKSDKGKKQFLLDYFNEYNNSIDKLNPN